MSAPRDESGRFISKRTIPRYRITVWNTVDGDIEEKLWAATEQDLDEIEKRYADEPMYEIQVEDLP